MPRFAANLSLLFAELPYLDRFDAAAAAGFDAVEILFPYEIAAKETRRALLRNGLELVLINAPPPNYAGGAPGYAALPGGQDRFRHDFRRALRYAEALQARFVHVMAGNASGDDAGAAMIDNLRWAADLSPLQGLTIEPLNPVDRPGYFLNDFDLAQNLIAAVDRPNLGLQFDAYHAQLITGDALAAWDRYGGSAHHIQIADAPGRVPPGQGGAIDFPALFRAIDASGYSGRVSAEYHPGGPTEGTLGWRG